MSIFLVSSEFISFNSQISNSEIKICIISGAVRVVEITQVTKTTATVSWDDLESDITYYKVELFSNDLLVNSTNTTVDVQHYENLMPQTEYKVK